MGGRYPELWVLRHGETAWNVEGRLQGHLDSPLTEAGARQARVQGEILARLLPGAVPVWCSPAGRARRTAEIVCAGTGLAVEYDDALKEIGIGGWQGRTVAEIRAAHPGLPHLNDPHLWKFHAPGGESLAEMAARLAGFLDRLEGPSVVITHGVTSRLLRCLVTGRAPEEMSDLPGGQGIVHHVKDGVARVIGAE